MADWYRDARWLVYLMRSRLPERSAQRGLPLAKYAASRRCEAVTKGRSLKRRETATLRQAPLGMSISMAGSSHKFARHLAAHDHHQLDLSWLCQRKARMLRQPKGNYALSSA